MRAISTYLQRMRSKVESRLGNELQRPSEYLLGIKNLCSSLLEYPRVLYESGPIIDVVAREVLKQRKEKCPFSESSLKEDSEIYARVTLEAFQAFIMLMLGGKCTSERENFQRFAEANKIPEEIRELVDKNLK